MKLNLRTIIILVILISTLAIAIVDVLMELFLVAASILLLFIINSNIHRRNRILHRLKKLTYFLIIISLTQIIFRGGEDIIWQWGIINISKTGLEYGFAISLRYIILILVAGLLLDINFTDYLHAFQAWKFPLKFSFLLTSTIHFIHIFSQNFSEVKENLQIRGIRLRALTLSQKINAYISIILPVLGKSLNKIQFHYAALELKGFGLNESKTHIYRNKLHWYDFFIQFLALLIFIIVIFYLIKI